ncbi:metallophosphoesterase family protein [Candidatus Omnitrophota bacterium]
MRYALFSDVHGNLEAFQAVLGALHGENIDAYLFLGDIVGYGADPEACIDGLRKLKAAFGCVCIAGNHDYAVCDMTSTEHFNMYAKAATEWTEQKLTSDDIGFLKQLDVVYHSDMFSIVHASLNVPEEWRYIFDIDAAQLNFERFKRQICFIGHSHRPLMFSFADSVDCFFVDKLVLQENTKYIVNVGSVGQPRDGDPRASYAVLDTDAATVEVKRIDYDIEKAHDKIIKAGLPKFLATRLKEGR